MDVITCRMNSKIYVWKKAFDESWQHPTTYNKMGWLREIIVALWELWGICCMTKAYLCICGMRHATQHSICRIGVLIGFLVWLHWRKLDVSHFKIFGAFVYFHVSKDLRNNLEPTIELEHFVDYTKNPHNYLVYLPSLIMTVVRRDVKFDEDKAMCWSLEREL